MSTSVMTLHEQREVFKRATAPGRTERLCFAAACGLLAVAVGLVFLAVIVADARHAWTAVMVVFAAGGLAECGVEKRRARRRLRPSIEQNQPEAVRIALYVLQPQFEEIGVLVEGGLIEVMADPFTLNAAERDDELDLRLADAWVRYERVDNYTAHLHYYRPEEV